MTQKKFDRSVEALLKRAETVRTSKGSDYSEDNDRLSNFKTIAKEIGTRPELVWAVYFRKHIDAVMKHTRAGQTESEPIEDRLVDIINYCLLYNGLVEESKSAKAAKQMELPYLKPVGGLSQATQNDIAYFMRGGAGTD